MSKSKAVTQDSASSGTRSNNIFLQVLGPDRLGHVRELGFGFTPFNTVRTSTSKGDTPFTTNLRQIVTTRKIRHLFLTR